MIFHPTDFEGLWVVEPAVFQDARGFFLETYRHDAFARQGIRAEFVQDNHSHSVRGVLRGLHYQVEPRAQAKLVRVVSGEVFDVVVDLRRSSRTFGRWFGLHLSGSNHKMLYVPEGFAHGFMTLSEKADVIYKVSQPYSPEHERGVRWDDPSLAIVWPSLGAAPSLSEKDRRLPGLQGAAV